MDQKTLAMGTGFEMHGRPTRKAEFLAEMEILMPWPELCALVEPHYPKAGNGRTPIGRERMLRMYWVAKWFNLADEACEDAMYDIPVFREFCGLDLGRERIPDATTLLKFRHLLEESDFGKELFARLRALLQANGVKVSGGAIVDATLIAAPPSPTNEEKARDPEMHQVKKGNRWHFGMKVHVGADSPTGLIHSAAVTAANVHDSQQVQHLQYGDETRLYCDRAYRGKAQRERLKEIAPNAQDLTQQEGLPERTADRRRKGDEPTQAECSRQGRVPFVILKRLCGFAKVAYRGLTKNANRVFAMLAATNILKHGRPLTGGVIVGMPCRPSA